MRAYDVQVETYRQVTVTLNDERCIEVLKNAVRDYVRALNGEGWDVKYVIINHIVIDVQVRAIDKEEREMTFMDAIRMSVKDEGGNEE